MGASRVASLCQSLGTASKSVSMGKADLHVQVSVHCVPVQVSASLCKEPASLRKEMGVVSLCKGRLRLCARQ